MNASDDQAEDAAPAKTAVTKLSILGLRGYAQSKTLELAQPNGAVGSGLTIIVGPNNSGKSTILEALMAVTQGGQPPTFSEGKRNTGAESRVRIELENSKGEVKAVATVPAGGSETLRENANVEPPVSDVFVLPSRRTFNSFFGRGLADRSSYVQSQQRLPNQRTGSSELHSRLFHIIADEGRFRQFNDVFRRVIDPVPEWTIEQSDQGQYYVKFTADDYYHSSEGLGEGLLSLLYVIDALYDSNPDTVVAIDEPELSLHPPVQRRLMKLFSEYAQDRQIILSTHSPLFVDWQAIVNGAKVVRVIKQAGQCEIYHLKQETRERLAGLIRDMNNPHTLGLDANEVFFLEDKVVLLEGQEDVLYYPELLDQLGIAIDGAFFGWGVGGADKMTTIASLLRDLGFQRVSGVVDQNRAAVVGDLQAEFPEYLFFSIPADDIRTKVARPAKGAVSGLLDDAGNLRPEFEAETRQLINDVNTYMGT